MFISIGFYYNYKKLRAENNIKLNAIYNNIEKENLRKTQLNLVSSEVEIIKKLINSKFLNIKIDIFNLHFSINELFKTL